MKRQLMVWIVSIFLIGSLQAADPQFVIFTGSYNNAQWAEKSLESLAVQTYPNWECIYVNDASTDNTLEKVQETILKHNLSDKITVINHQDRCGLISNMNRYLRQVDPHKIIVILDGDDFLSNKGVLKRVAKAYKNSSVWMTYGNYTPYPEMKEHHSLCRPLPSKVLKKNTFRKHRFVTSHLRTFYAKLFHNILEQDLQEKGSFFQIAGDVITMLPMLEMSSKGHILFIDEVLLLYNAQNPLSDYRRRKEQIRVEKLIRSRAPYKPLKTLF